MVKPRDESNGAASATRRDPSIQSRVFSLIAIVLIPLLLLFTWLAAQFAQSQRRIIEVERLAIATNLTNLLDRQIAETQGILIGLANSEALRLNDFDHFKRHAEVIVNLLPKFRAIQLVDLSGHIKVSTNGTPSHFASDEGRRKSIEPVFKGRAMVSDIFPANGDRPATYTVSVPVVIADMITYALIGDTRTDALNGIFVQAGLKPEWVSAIVDRHGRFAARSLNPKQHVGHFAARALIEVAKMPNQAGEFENVTLEGLHVVNSFQKSATSEWTSVVAVPKEILSKPYWRLMILVVAGGGIIILLSVALASIMASRISEPIRHLRDMANALIEGRTIPDTQLKISELNEVRTAFKTAVSKSGHLAAIVASTGDAIISIGLDGRIRSWNHGAERLFGFSPEDMIGQTKDPIIPIDRAAEMQRHLEIIRAGESLRTETVLKTRDGTPIEVSLDMAPIMDSDGKIVAMSSIIHDITSRKRAEKHQRFLMRELTHRSKNLLALVQSMARQTARSAATLKDFETEYMQRLQGIAASHDLLVNQNWTGAPLNELIRRQVEPFVETNRANLAISGPDIIISAKAAQTIGLALHELATNSMKYGALSTPKGKVSIDWEFHQTGGEPQRLKLKWEEHNGPPVTPPARKGFGHFVIDRMATQSLSAKVTIDFRPEGLVWIIDATAQALQSEPEFDAGDGASA